MHRRERGRAQVSRGDLLTGRQVSAVSRGVHGLQGRQQRRTAADLLGLLERLRAQERRVPAQVPVRDLLRRRGLLKLRRQLRQLPAQGLSGVAAALPQVLRRLLPQREGSLRGQGQAELSARRLLRPEPAEVRVQGRTHLRRRRLLNGRLLHHRGLVRQGLSAGLLQERRRLPSLHRELRHLRGLLGPRAHPVHPVLGRRVPEHRRGLLRQLQHRLRALQQRLKLRLVRRGHLPLAGRPGRVLSQPVQHSYLSAWLLDPARQLRGPQQGRPRELLRAQRRALSRRRRHGRHHRPDRRRAALRLTHRRRRAAALLGQQQRRAQRPGRLSARGLRPLRQGLHHLSRRHHLKHRDQRVPLRHRVSLPLQEGRRRRRRHLRASRKHRLRRHRHPRGLTRRLRPARLNARAHLQDLRRLRRRRLNHHLRLVRDQRRGVPRRAHPRRSHR